MSATLISGSSRGLGKGLATFLREQGQEVITNSRHEIEGAYSSSHYVFDCQNREAVRRALGYISKRFDVKNLIGVVGSGSLRSDDPDLQWKLNLDINFYSAVILFEEAVAKFPNLKNVIFVSSIAGSIVMTDPPIPYSVSKSALNHYARLLALTYAPNGMLINVISPGNLMFDGSVWDKRMSKEPELTMSYIRAEVPLGTFVEIKSVASIVKFLLIDNQQITGQIIAIDGGQSI